MMRNTIFFPRSRIRSARCRRALCVGLVVPWLFACAALGTADYKTGMMYHKLGLYYPARNSFKIAAREGNAEAKNMLGWYWANGLGHLPKDIVNACNWYA